MKAKDYFANLKSQAKLNNEAYDAFLATVPEEFEIPDPVKAVIEENFLTKDRAASDKDIMKKAKAEFYNAMDANIAEVLAGLPKFDQVAIEAEKDTHKKLKMMDAAYRKSYEELKKSAPEGTKVNEEHLTTIRDLTARLDLEKKNTEKVVSEYTKKMEDQEKQLVLREKAIRVKSDLTNKIGQVEFAKEYVEDPIRKQDAINAMLGRILQHDLDYDEQGNMVVQEVVNGVAKPKFFPGTNDQVTIDKLLETETSRYIKKNNGQEHVKELEKTKRKILDTPAAGQTLAQRRVAAAQD